MDVLYSVSKQLKQKAVNLADTVGGTEMEKKVKAATSNEHYPTPLSQLQDIAAYTNDYAACREIMPLVWKRMNESPQYWRIIYKTLVLLRELIRFGSERVIDETRDHLFNLRQLENFHHTEEGKERGNGIREVAREIMELVNDEGKLRQVREESTRNKGKFTAMGSGGSSYGGMGSGSSGGGGGGYDAYSGPTGKYSGFGGGSDSYSGGSSTYGGSGIGSHQADDNPYGESSSSSERKGKSKSKSSRQNEDDGDDPYADAPSSRKKKKKDDKEKEGKKKKKSSKEEPAPAEPEPEASPLDDDAEAERKKNKKAKKAKEAAEAAKLNAPKVTEGGKLAPPPDLFATSSSTPQAADNDFASFASAPVQPIQPASSSNTLDSLFGFDAPTSSSSSSSGFDSGFGDFTSSSSSFSSSKLSSNASQWDAFAGSSSSSGSSGFDLLSTATVTPPQGRAPNGAALRHQQESEAGVFEAFQSKPAQPATQTTNNAAAANKNKDAWMNDLVKLDLGSSKPAAGTQSSAALHIPTSKSLDPFGHLVQNQPQRPMQQQRPAGQMGMGGGMGMMGMQQQGGMGMQGGMMGMGGMQQGMGIDMQGGVGMGMGIPMGMRPPMQGGMGMGMGMGGAGFGFPQAPPKKNMNDIFFQ